MERTFTPEERLTIIKLGLATFVEGLAKDMRQLRKTQEKAIASRAELGSAQTAQIRQMKEVLHEANKHCVQTFSELNRLVASCHQLARELWDALEVPEENIYAAVQQTETGFGRFGPIPDRKNRRSS